MIAERSERRSSCLCVCPEEENCRFSLSISLYLSLFSLFLTGENTIDVSLYNLTSISRRRPLLTPAISPCSASCWKKLAAAKKRHKKRGGTNTALD